MGMNLMEWMWRIQRASVDVLGLQLKDVVGFDERVRNVRATATIGMVVACVFSVFNILTEGMLKLGLTELAAVVFLLGPAAWLSRSAHRVGYAEALIQLAALTIFGALIVFGGVQGTGLFWVCTVPFLVFFLKGQRLGWLTSMSFLALAVVYFAWINERLDFSYKYTPVVAVQFLLSLFFYTLVAAAFNQLRSRFEEQLQRRVDQETAAARELLSEKQFLATHDTLTSLPNRALLLDILAQQMKEVLVSGQGLMVCILRLERLFEMSNVLGSEGGDNLVRQVAGHLGRISLNQGALARTRRGEFVIVRRLVQPAVSPDELRQFVADHQLLVQEQGYTLFVEFTMGVAIFPSHADSAQLLLNKAEQAMLQAHKSGQQWSVYDAAQEQAFVRHHLLFGKLREALLKQHLQVHFQPQIDLRTGMVTGAEALARWHDPETGMVPPITFIPVAEESGLIRPLTNWVVGECMRTCASWQKLGLALDVSINLSALNLLDPELMGALNNALTETGLNPRCVTLEITESCFMTSPERALEVIQRIHERGFKLSIDDFGTGYSSLSYLKNLPIDELKIDQGFVRHLLESVGDQAIVSSTIDLAHNFNLSVVAEGVEDEATVTWLRARGCDVGQGYCFARPMPAADFLKFVQARGARIDH
jgi:diguanylate cyclase (GGDEF)-like protein